LIKNSTLPTYDLISIAEFTLSRMDRCGSNGSANSDGMHGSRLNVSAVVVVRNVIRTRPNVRSQNVVERYFHEKLSVLIRRL